MSSADKQQKSRKFTNTKVNSALIQNAFWSIPDERYDWTNATQFDMAITKLVQSGPVHKRSLQCILFGGAFASFVWNEMFGIEAVSFSFSMFSCDENIVASPAIGEHGVAFSSKKNPNSSEGWNSDRLAMWNSSNNNNNNNTNNNEGNLPELALMWFHSSSIRWVVVVIVIIIICHTVYGQQLENVSHVGHQCRDIALPSNKHRAPHRRHRLFHQSISSKPNALSFSRQSSRATFARLKMYFCCYHAVCHRLQSLFTSIGTSVTCMDGCVVLAKRTYPIISANGPLLAVPVSQSVGSSSPLPLFALQMCCFASQVRHQQILSDI